MQKLINKVFRSGELDECELTLKELHLIAKCFTRVLNGIYHQRIAYAEPAEKVNPGGKGDDEENEEKRPESDEDDAEDQRHEDTLRRLGQDPEI